MLNIPQSPFKHHHFLSFLLLHLFVHCGAVRVSLFEQRCCCCCRRTARGEKGLVYARNSLQRNGNHVLMRGSWSMKRTNELHTIQATNRIESSARIMLVWVAGGIHAFFLAATTAATKNMGKWWALHRTEEIYFDFWNCSNNSGGNNLMIDVKHPFKWSVIRTMSTASWRTFHSSRMLKKKNYAK